MKVRNVMIVGVIVIALFIGFVKGYEALNEEEEVLITTSEQKLLDMSFAAQDNYYVRDVSQDDQTYQEIFDLENNNFIRKIEEDSDKEVYSYNYDKNTFTYLYYFDDELIIKLVYDYSSEEIVQDESEQYENLSDDIESLKSYFDLLISNNELVVSEL